MSKYEAVIESRMFITFQSLRSKLQWPVNLVLIISNQSMIICVGKPYLALDLELDRDMFCSARTGELNTL